MMELRKIGKAIHDSLLGKITARRLTATILGNIVMGVGAAGLRVSGMGNEPYNAAMMAFSDGLQMGQGDFQIRFNLVLLLVQLVFGWRSIGVGTLINMTALGYIAQGMTTLLTGLFAGVLGSIGFQLPMMALSMAVMCLGISMYQIADLGISPYDFLPFGLQAHTKLPYFTSRMLIDGLCVASVAVAALCGMFPFSQSHLGVGTVLGAFCLGPMISFFNRYNKAWITPAHTNAVSEEQPQHDR